MILIAWVVLLLVNFGISWANAEYVGRYWSESKATGGSFRRYIICGYVMAIAGFTMVYGCILLVSVPMVMKGYGVDKELITLLEQIGSDMLYVMVGVPIILCGFRIWLVSLAEAWRNRTFGNVASAGWNTYAQLHNIRSATREMPSAINRLFSIFFGKKSSKKKGEEVIAILAIIIVILALCSGYFTANKIMKDADREYDAFKGLEYST